MTYFNTRSVNAAIRDLGGTEKLVRGKGYWYFCEGDSASWPDASVYTMHLGDLTLTQWIEEYKALKADAERYRS